MTTSMKDLLGIDGAASESFLLSTEIGRRFRESGVEEDDPDG
jgi:hypothetical protein